MLSGLSTLPALCRNFTFALPNKIFEYIAADLPVLVAHYPEAKRLVLDNGLGLTFDPYDPRSIANAINQLMQNEKLRVECTANVRATLSRVNAQKEWQKIVSIYDDLSRKSSMLTKFLR